MRMQASCVPIWAKNEVTAGERRRFLRADIGKALIFGVKPVSGSSNPSLCTASGFSFCFLVLLNVII